MECGQREWLFFVVCVHGWFLVFMLLQFISSIDYLSFC